MPEMFSSIVYLKFRLITSDRATSVEEIVRKWNQYIANPSYDDTLDSIQNKNVLLALVRLVQIFGLGPFKAVPSDDQLCAILDSSTRFGCPAQSEKNVKKIKEMKEAVSAALRRPS